MYKLFVKSLLEHCDKRKGSNVCLSYLDKEAYDTIEEKEKYMELMGITQLISEQLKR